MDDVASLPAIAQGGIGAALAILAAIAWLFVRARLRARDESRAARESLRAELASAEAEWREASRGDDPARLHAAKRRVDRLRGLLAKCAPAVLMAGLCPAWTCGCASRRVVETVALTEHVVVLRPGDVLPPLPAGEPHWWCATPRGLRMLLPADSAIPAAPTP